jgi:hypothetical protein
MILYSFYQLLLNHPLMDDRESGSSAISPAESARIHQFQMTTFAVFCSSLTHF